MLENMPTHQQQADMAEAFPVAYTLHFDVANFIVTEEAHEQFGLTPLVAQNGLKQGGYTNRIDFYLAGASEMETLGVPLPDLGEMEVKPDVPDDLELDDESLEYLARQESLGTGIGLLAVPLESRLVTISSFSSDRQRLADVAKERPPDQILRMMGRDPALEEPLDEQMVSDQISQTLAHVLVATVATSDEMRSALVDISRNEDGRNFLNSTYRTVGIGALGIAATLLLVGVGPEEGMSYMDLVPSGLVGVAATSSHVARIRHRLSVANIKEGLHSRLAERETTNLAGSIHRSFCSNHFDEMMRGQFDGMFE